MTPTTSDVLRPSPASTQAKPHIRKQDGMWSITYRGVTVRGFVSVAAVSQWGRIGKPIRRGGLDLVRLDMGSWV